MNRLVCAVGAGCLVLSGCELSEEVVAPEERPTLSTVIEVSPPQDLNPGSESYSLVWATSDAGHAAGYLGNQSTGKRDAFVWFEAGLRVLPDLGGDAQAQDVNSEGIVVGTVSSSAGEFAAIWQDGLLRQLEDQAVSLAATVNETGLIGGQRGYRPTIWEHGVYRELPRVVGDREYAVGYVLDLNDLGEAVGVLGDPQTLESAAVSWPTGSQPVRLPPLPGFEYFCYPAAINNRGEVFGHCTNGSDPLPVVWRAGSIERLPLPAGFTNGVVTDANDLGQAVGYVYAPGVQVTPLHWFEETTTFLSTTGYGVAYAINGSGMVGGYLRSGTLPAHATLWTVSVRPATPSEEIAILTDGIQSLAAAGKISAGEARSLMVLLAAAARQVGSLQAAVAMRQTYDPGATAAAARLFEAFIRRIEALVRAGRLTESEAAPLIEAAQNAISQLG